MYLCIGNFYKRENVFDIKFFPHFLILEVKDSKYQIQLTHTHHEMCGYSFLIEFYMLGIVCLIKYCLTVLTRLQFVLISIEVIKNFIITGKLTSLELAVVVQFVHFN
jgi:hypothetical protein